MAYDRRAKAEQLEIIQDKVKKIVGDMARCTALTEAAFAQAGKSLEALRACLHKLKQRP